MVSEIALGSWLTYGGSVERSQSVACVRRAVELGVNYLDTADAYARGEAERTLADAIEPFERHKLVIATKAFWPMSDDVNDRGLSRKHVIESVHNSLRRLRTDYVDIFYCHRHDPGTPLDETLRAIDDLVAQGKVLYGAVSEWPAAELTRAAERTQALGLRPLVADQVHYNIIEPEIEQDILPSATAAGMGIVAFSPLAEGVLTGKYRGGKAPAGSRGSRRSVEEYLTPRALAQVDELVDLAERAAATPVHLALRWVLRRPEVASALVGASSIAQVEQNCAAGDYDVPSDVSEALFSIAG